MTSSHTYVAQWLARWSVDQEVTGSNQTWGKYFFYRGTIGNRLRRFRIRCRFLPEVLPVTGYEPEVTYICHIRLYLKAKNRGPIGNRLRRFRIRCRFLPEVHPVTGYEPEVT